MPGLTRLRTVTPPDRLSAAGPRSRATVDSLETCDAVTPIAEICRPESAPRRPHFASPAMQQQVRHSAPFIAQFIGQMDELLRTAERRRNRRLSAIESYQEGAQLETVIARPAVRKLDRRY